MLDRLEKDFDVVVEQIGDAGVSRSSPKRQKH
jgi:hypothetical protein